MHRRWLLCRIGERLCGIPLAHVVETMRPLPVEPVPESPPGVVGLAIIRGAATPVVDAASLLGEEEPPGRLVTLRLGDRRVALALPEVLGVREVAPEIQDELPPLLAQNPAVERLGVLDEKLFIVLRSAVLFP